MNLATMLRQTAVVAIASLGMTFVILLGGIDLSIGSAVALTGVVVARALQAGAGAAGAVALGVLVPCPAYTGLLNGALTARAKITPPFIVTLGSMSVLRGVAKGLAGEQKIDADPHGLERRFHDGRPPLAALLPTACGYRWSRSPCSRRSPCISRCSRAPRGRDRLERADRAAVRRAVERVVLCVYALCGALTGVAGVLRDSRRSPSVIRRIRSVSSSRRSLPS